MLHDELRDELGQLRSECQAEYQGKERALDSVLRAKFGASGSAGLINDRLGSYMRTGNMM